MTVDEQRGAESEDVSVFEIRSDVTATRSERLYRLFDRNVLAPVRIGWEDLRVRIGSLVIFTYILAGTVGVMVVEPPVPSQAPRDIRPFQTMAHPLGTDGLGNDMLSLLVHATPPMLKMILAGAVFATGVAVVVGTTAGYLGGKSDHVLMYITDTMMAIPALPLIVVIAAIVQPQNAYMVGIILALNRWAGLARSLRSEVLSIREAEYVEASQFIGLSTSTIIRNDILPNLMPYTLVNFMQSAREIIFASVGLYFLGLLPMNSTNWGVIMNMGFKKQALSRADRLHWMLEPMFVIIIFTIGIILFAQGTDRLFNPRVRARHQKTTDDEEHS
jgi:peptide/nickel transport system permease protein